VTLEGSAQHTARLCVWRLSHKKIRALFMRVWGWLKICSQMRI